VEYNKRLKEGDVKISDRDEEKKEASDWKIV